MNELQPGSYELRLAARSYDPKFGRSYKIYQCPGSYNYPNYTTTTPYASYNWTADKQELRYGSYNLGATTDRELRSYIIRAYNEWELDTIEIKKL